MQITRKNEQNDSDSQIQSLGNRKYVKIEWTKQEDQALEQIIGTAIKKIMWSRVARDLNTQFHQKDIRTANQCKSRWITVLLPLKNYNWTSEKEQKMLELYKAYGVYTKIFYEECHKQIEGLTHDQIKVYLDIIVEKHQLKNLLWGGMKVPKNKTKNHESAEPEIVKKTKTNDANISVLCSKLSVKME